MSGADLYDRDLYRLLGVNPSTSQEVIDAAYRALMKLHAPRKINDDDAAAREIGAAYEVLKDKASRKKYDTYRETSNDGLIGPYKIMNRVAEGGFGITYKAKHTRLGGFSCIKHCSEVSPIAEKILEQETLATWDLRHYGLPIMRDFLKLDDGSHALAMSWVEGSTIEQIVEKHGRLDPEHVAWMTERILNTLVYLHHHGVLHGDIKPQNVMVQEESHMIVLVDFGLAVVKPAGGDRSLGYTEVFSPPEQMAGKGLLPGSDFYSLGMTMLYALGGSYGAAQSKEVPEEVPEPLCNFIRSLLVRDVMSRPRNADKLFDEFKKVRKASFGRSHTKMKRFPT